MSKDLTVKALKDAFGEEYDAINKLIENKPDDYVFSSWGLVNLNDFFVRVVWGKEDIWCRLDRYKKVAPTDENVDKIFEELQLDGEDDWINEDETMIDMVNEDIDRTIEGLIESKKLKLR